MTLIHIMTVTENKTCCKIEAGALIYGIFNILLTAPASIIGIGFILYFAIHEHNEMSAFIFLTGICTAPCLLVLVFSIVLVCGVCKKTPGLVLAHFIFGIIFTIVTMTLSLHAMITISDGYSEEGVIAFFVFLIYSLPLVVVYLTYVKFSSGRAAYQHCNKSGNTWSE